MFQSMPLRNPQFFISVNRIPPPNFSSDL